MPDPIHEELSGLSFKASIKWPLVSYVDDLAADGILIFVGPNGSYFSDPIAVPSNADARIKLAPPKQMIEKTECRSIDGIPKLRFSSITIRMVRVALWMCGYGGCLSQWAAISHSTITYRTTERNVQVSCFQV